MRFKDDLALALPNTASSLDSLEERLEHLKPFKMRDVKRLEDAISHGWHLKRYAVFAEGKAFDPDMATAATVEAFDRLPVAGSLKDASGNHGTGFQIIHFAEIAVVSPIFYWQWGSVLARLCQIKASWDNPTVFNTGVEEIVGCVWEMKIVQREVEAWTSSVLGGCDEPEDGLSNYLMSQ